MWERRREGVREGREGGEKREREVANGLSGNHTSGSVTHW